MRQVRMDFQVRNSKSQRRKIANKYSILISFPSYFWNYFAILYCFLWKYLAWFCNWFYFSSARSLARYIDQVRKDTEY